MLLVLVDFQDRWLMIIQVLYYLYALQLLKSLDSLHLILFGGSMSLFPALQVLTGPAEEVMPKIVVTDPLRDGEHLLEHGSNPLQMRHFYYYYTEMSSDRN